MTLLELPRTAPDALAGQIDRVDLLLSYQQELLATTAANAVTVAEKSRRIGFTWGVAADGVLTAGSAKSAGGMDVLYIGYNLDMAREFIDTCASWARLFDRAASAVLETVFEDGEASIKAFRISFASGFEILALASRPRSLRGRQGYVIIDEAAFHDDLPELLKSAMALLIWGGKVLIISTHDGVDNPFNQLVEDVRAKKLPYALLRVTFDDALADGLYRRICLVTGKPWSAEAERAWRNDIFAFYGPAADEELNCVPRNAGGVWLPRTLIEARMSRDLPVLRWRAPPGFVDRPELETRAEVLEWCEANLRPHLASIDPLARTAFGQDFGRSGDLSVMCPAEIRPDLVRRLPFIAELRDMPFAEQQLVAFYILDRLPRLSHAAFDAGGNGAGQAEAARRRYGPARVSEVKFTEDWYRRHMPPLKAAFEGSSILLPADIDVRGDLQAVVMEGGIARVPANARTAGADGGQRHGDAAIAVALAWFASEQTPGAIDFRSTGRRPTGGIDDFLHGNQVTAGW